MPERINLMLFELIDMGFFQCLLPWTGNPWIFCLGWFGILLGAGLQVLFLRKEKNWHFLLFALFLCVMGEAFCHAFTGLTLLLALILYGLAITLLMGVVFTTFFHALRKRREKP